MSEELDILTLEYYKKMPVWIQSTRQFLRKSLPLMMPLGTNPNISNDKKSTLGALSTACYRNAGSSLYLIENSDVWDAEVINRSQAEGTLKFFYLLENSDFFEERYDEYANKLFEIDILKQHDKAKMAMKEGRSPEYKELKRILLSDDEYKKLSAKYKSAERSRLQEKWGFTGLVRNLSKSSAINEANRFSSLLHGYSMASHTNHNSYLGVSIFIERDHRAEPMRSFVYIAHASRIISDIHAFTFLRLLIALKFTGADTKSLELLMNDFEGLRNEIAACYNDWSRNEQ